MGMNVQDATLALAASVVERSRDLIDDGWVKGTFYQYTDNGGIKAPKTFCILGALELAAMELFEGVYHKEANREIIDVATYFILDEIRDLMGHAYGSIPGFNDEAARTHEQVLKVLDNAARRLWDLSVENGELGVDLTRFVDVEPEETAQQFLHAVLA